MAGLSHRNCQVDCLFGKMLTHGDITIRAVFTSREEVGIVYSATSYPQQHDTENTMTQSAGTESVVSGRCYCGASRITASQAPLAVAYCHCADCRRVTGAPVAVFAEFNEADIRFDPEEGPCVSISPGVSRHFCRECGSPLGNRFDYLPGRVYVAIGLLDQADDLAPNVHAHYGRRIRWLHIDDNLERFEESARNWFG